MVDNIRLNLEAALGQPDSKHLARSRARVEDWLLANAPLIRWSEAPSPVGQVSFAVSEAGLCALTLGRGLEDILPGLDPCARLIRDDEGLNIYRAQISEYFAGARRRFDLPLDLRRVRTFQRRVLEAALNIPAGQAWSYRELARAIGDEKASRAVGTALARNPIPLVIPCHRVIGSDGRMHGYATGDGIATKQWLLRFEGALG